MLDEELGLRLPRLLFTRFCYRVTVFGIVFACKLYNYIYCGLLQLSPSHMKPYGLTNIPTDVSLAVLPLVLPLLWEGIGLPV